MKRAITAIELPGVIPGTPPTPKPELTWISPADLVVDEAYQRDLSDRSVKLIRRIVEAWDWRRFKPPIVTWTDEGLEVIDGQHSATAAVCHPGIDTIPVVVVEATERQDRASAFIGHNRDRIGVTAAQMQVAAVAAGDKDALAVEAACRLANVRLLRVPPSRGDYQPGETIAAGQIGLLVKKRGVEKAAEILTVLALAGFAPIQASHIKAVEQILTDEEAPVRPEDLTRAVMALGMGPAEKEAKLFAGTHNVPLWRGLVAVWLQALKKRRRPAAAAKDEAGIAPPSPAPSARPTDPETPSRPEQPASGGGYVPGPLMKRCPVCDRSYVGGRASTKCQDCAGEQEDRP
ncbi:hypothetical protein [Enterovirga sp. CN4-39]|uniref:hypothetical protein n=1 Tax=Enterovirga sp. CN4-39 TaxID=3400910 RepID=UPI003BFB3C22